MAVPTDLGSRDTGLLVMIAEYNHLLRWNGASWEFAPGDDGSGFVQDFLAAPGDGWVACDGATTDYLTVTPTVAATPITLPVDPGTAPYTRYFRR